MTKPRRSKKPLVENGAGAGRLSADRASSGLKFKVLAEWPGSAKSWGGFWESVARSLNGPMRDVALAQARLGGTADDRCRWLLDTFVPRDPDTLSTSERAMVRDNLTALTLVSWADMPLTEPYVAGSLRAIDEVALREADAELHKAWEQIVALTGTAQKQQLPPIEQWLYRRREPPYVRFDHAHSAPSGRASFTTVLQHVVAGLLRACQRLKECPECSRLFVARRRQERHAKCARQARDRRRPSRQPKPRKR